MLRLINYVLFNARGAKEYGIYITYYARAKNLIFADMYLRLGCSTTRRPSCTF